MAGFDPNYTAGSVLTLSNNNLTVTKTSPTDYNYANSLSTPNPGGKVYLEVQIVGNTYFGFADQMLQLGPASNVNIGNQQGSIGFLRNGGWRLNGVFNASGGLVYVAGDVVGVALDTAGKTVQVCNITQSGAWSSTFDVSSFGQPSYLFGITLANPNDAATVNFAGAFVGTLPPGYVGWGSAAPGSQGWGQKVYYNGYNVITAPPASIAPGNFAVRTYYNDHSPVALE